MAGRGSQSANKKKDIALALADAIKGETSRPLAKPMRRDIKEKAIGNLLDEALSRTKLRFDSLPSDNDLHM